MNAIQVRKRWEMTKINQYGRRYVEESDGEKPMECDARENGKTLAGGVKRKRCD
jgi:hypothetical protein